MINPAVNLYDSVTRIEDTAEKDPGRRERSRQLLQQDADPSSPSSTEQGEFIAFNDNFLYAVYQVGHLHPGRSRRIDRGLLPDRLGRDDLCLRRHDQRRLRRAEEPRPEQQRRPERLFAVSHPSQLHRLFQRVFLPLLPEASGRASPRRRSSQPRACRASSRT